MTQTLEKLFEAHVHYELQQWSEASLKLKLDEDLELFLASFERIHLKDWTSAEKIHLWLRELLVARPISKDWRKWVSQCLLETRRNLAASSTSLESLLHKKVHDQIIKNLINSPELRDELIHQVINNDFTERLFSELLYVGIKNFVTQENAVTRKIPGAAKLLQMGQSFVTQNMPSLEANIEKAIKQFLQSHIRDYIQMAEGFLSRGLTPQTMEKLGEEIWTYLSQQTMQDLMRFLPEDNVKANSKIIDDYWDHFRKTPFFDQLLRDWSALFYETYKKQNLRQLLEKFGLTSEQLKRDLLKLLLPWVEHWRKSGELEIFIRKRLSDFYQSDSAKKIVSSHK